MSELEDVCNSLNAINGDILRTSQELHTKAQAYNRASAQAAAAARSAEGEAAAALARAAAALAAASQYCGRAAQSLVGASNEGQAFVRRTVGGGGPESGATATSPGSLTLADRAALWDYTGFGYVDLNRALRGQIPMNDELSRRANAVSIALSKLPDKPGVSFRGSTLSDSQLARYVPGARVVESGFTSSASNPKRSFGGNSYFYIQGKHGKDVAPYSQQEYESEVLFNRDACFFVHSHTVDADGKHVIMLIEV